MVEEVQAEKHTGLFVIKLCEKTKSTLNIRKRFFIERVVNHWNRLPMEMVTAPNLREVKEHLDNAPSSMV